MLKRAGAVQAQVESAIFEHDRERACLSLISCKTCRAANRNFPPALERNPRLPATNDDVDCRSREGWRRSPFEIGIVRRTGWTIHCTKSRSLDTADDRLRRLGQQQFVTWQRSGGMAHESKYSQRAEALPMPGARSSTMRLRFMLGSSRDGHKRIFAYTIRRWKGLPRYLQASSAANTHFDVSLPQYSRWRRMQIPMIAGGVYGVLRR